MIPLSAKGFVEFTDEDGIIWRFKPKCGDTEDMLLSYVEGKEIAYSASVKNARDLVDLILLGWSDPQNKGMKQFPTDGKASVLFTPDERGKILEYWHKANRLTVEEKKIS
jgi:hypothetical protein